MADSTFCYLLFLYLRIVSYPYQFRFVYLALPLQAVADSRYYQRISFYFCFDCRLSLLIKKESTRRQEFQIRKRNRQRCLALRDRHVCRAFHLLCLQAVCALDTCCRLLFARATLHG